MQTRALLASAALLSAGCSLDPLPLCGADGASAFIDGACIDPIHRYEPASPVDDENVVAYGDPLVKLDLPPPPKRGFRLIAAPRMVAPGEEILDCVSWPFPKGLTSSMIHAGRLYTTPGLHHSNVVTKPIDPDAGPQPHPACHPDAYDPFGQLPDVIPDVLFANSTQVVGEETMVFPPDVGFKVDKERDIVTSIHFLNTT